MRERALTVTVLCLVLLCSGRAGVAWAEELPTHVNSIGMEFVLIPAGSFMMGLEQASDEDSSTSHERTQHQVRISKPFYLGKYEVTQAQWTAVMDENPSKFEGADKPVEQISWNDAQEFIRRLNALEGHNRYRLPTEAEWEYAARAGTSSAYFFGDAEEELAKHAWYGANSDQATLMQDSPEDADDEPVGDVLYAGDDGDVDHGGDDEDWPEDGDAETSGDDDEITPAHLVGLTPANPWGLHDVHGNVSEWVQDWYGEDYYAGSPEVDPTGPESGEDRVLRGGSWADYAETCRSGRRRYSGPTSLDHDLGFRLAISVE